MKLYVPLCSTAHDKTLLVQSASCFGTKINLHGFEFLIKLRPIGENNYGITPIWFLYNLSSHG